MAGAEAAVEAAKETVVFLSYFEGLADYRQKGKVAYPLDEVLLMMLAASLSGAETVSDLTWCEFRDHFIVSTPQPGRYLVVAATQDQRPRITQ